MSYDEQPFLTDRKTRSSPGDGPQELYKAFVLSHAPIVNGEPVAARHLYWDIVAESQKPRLRGKPTKKRCSTATSQKQPPSYYRRRSQRTRTSEITAKASVPKRTIKSQQNKWLAPPLATQWRQAIEYHSFDVHSIRACQFARKRRGPSKLETQYLVRWTDTWVPEALLSSEDFPWQYNDIVHTSVVDYIVYYLVRWNDSWHFEDDLKDASGAVRAFRTA
ncbi:MAG: hypothetical protein Q9171_002912 [Xanthocarpia ochracea]